MLNPKLIDKYGEDAGRMLEKLAMEMGEELARTCYITREGYRDFIGGAKVPNGMTTTSGRREEVSNAVLSFVTKYRLAGENYWIIVMEDDVSEEDIQLWV